MIVPTKRHLALYQLLRSASRYDQNGELVSWWPQARLASKLGCSVRTLQNVLGDLREPGTDPRHPRRAAGLRLGLVRVIPTSYRDKATGRHRLGGNVYVIVPGQHATLAEPVSAAQVYTQEARVACLNKKPRSRGGYHGVDEGEHDSASNEPAPVPAVLEVGDQHEPSWADLRLDADGILDRLRAQLGDVEVLGVAANERLASDYMTARGRVIDLTGGTRPEGRRAVGDLHQAVDELDAETCRRVNGNGTERCMPGQPCGRHTPRRRIRPGRSPRPPPGPDQARGCGWAPVGSLLDELRVDRQCPLS